MVGMKTYAFRMQISDAKKLGAVNETEDITHREVEATFTAPEPEAEKQPEPESATDVAATTTIKKKKKKAKEGAFNEENLPIVRE